MKILIDFIPIALFFIAFKFYDIYIATAVAIIASIGQNCWYRYRNGKFENIHLITLAIIVILGGLTLIFQDERFIKWKPTIVNWAFAIAIIGVSIVTRKPAIGLLLANKLQLPTAVWRRLDIAWFIFFILSGIANLYVAYTFSTEIWVNFKLFGMMGLTFGFVILQSLFLYRHLSDQNELNH